MGSACCGPAGSIVIYDTTSRGMDHAAFSMGGGLISQHNPYRCRCPLCRHPYILFSCCLPRPKIQHLTRLHLAAPAALGARAVSIAKAAEIHVS